ncbi:unnamed protein product [Rotaria sp. Silwood1]|nr:unnamed protein product [Rotaria sp. Silwood1]CAF3438485.1 unnamed protein product [Rotaria sp. Silwood1]CAF3460577.1 unnamed protein product [Rotaria sp. Silwood1]CAF3465951.1 unnamed protein product [Rotaria sp. Silwood1]CAF4633321.1 unnamed protein product [Rotaria sp. Silwood1]
MLFSSSQTPHLISFRIVFYQASLIPFDFIQLIDIFNERLANLKRFECDILLSKGVNTIDLKTIRELHSFLFTHLKFVTQFNGMLRIYTTDFED